MLYLLRHGEIVGSEKKRYIGQTDVALSQKGLRQAAWWKEELSQVEIEKVYSSDLSRALDTARMVSDFPDSDIHTMSRLREIDLGDWDGETVENIKTRFPDAWKDRGRHMDTFRTPNGESFQDLHDRVIPVFLKIMATAHGNVLVVAHAGVNRIILCHVLKRPRQDLFNIPQDYGALNLIEHRKGRFQVLIMNQTPSRSALSCPA